jgi:hypothetical protein
MNATPQEVYRQLMMVLRRRLDLIGAIRSTNAVEFSKAETAAFHGRKSIEGIAFGCLVAIEHGLKHIPRDARGQWNAEKIFESLKSKNIPTLPSPSVIRMPTASEAQMNGPGAVVEGQPERRLTHEQLIAIYQRFHGWLHEVNPYVGQDQNVFYSKHGQALWDDLAKLDRFIEKHFISISGEGFFCVLRDDYDGQTKVLSLSTIGAS